jgi:hypothetical protein
MKGAYRAAAPSPTSTTPKRLELWLRDGDGRRWLRAASVKLWFTLGAVVIAWGHSQPLAGLIGLTGLFWAYRDWAARNGAAVALACEDGRVRVTAAGATRELDLADLLDVRLDTKTATKNVTQARADGVNSMFGMGSNHHIELDLSRVELVIARGTEGAETAGGVRKAGKERLLLDREYVSNSLCTESLRTIRLFLRGHGWKPEDERG